MIPLNQFTPTPQRSAFRSPLADKYRRFTMRAPGGIALNDGSRGREVQLWTVSYDGAVILVTPEQGAAFALAVPGVLSVSAAFDNNMTPCVAYMLADGAHLYFFNGLHNQYETLDIPGATSCRVCVDDPRDFNNADSDVMLAYLRGDILYWRQQRDRFAIERVVGPAHGVLVRFGLNVDGRLQFEVLNH